MQVLVDPVCFLTCYPQLLYSFVYKVPTLDETLGSITGLLSAARFLFSRDMIIAEVRIIAAHRCVPTTLPLHASPQDDGGRQGMQLSLEAHRSYYCTSGSLLCPDILFSRDMIIPEVGTTSAHHTPIPSWDCSARRAFCARGTRSLQRRESSLPVNQAFPIIPICPSQKKSKRQAVQRRARCWAWPGCAQEWCRHRTCL